MSTKSIFPFQIVAGGLLLSLLIFGCSSSEKDKTPIPLEGLWEITKTNNLKLPDEDLPNDGDPVEADPKGEGTPEGAAQLKNGETDSDSQELEDGTYLNLSSTSYRYFTRSEGVEQGLCSGTYLRKGSELTFIAANEDTTMAEILELRTHHLKLEIDLGQTRQEWTLERIAQNTVPEEEDDEGQDDENSDDVDYESYHDLAAPKGSMLNPYSLADSLDLTIEDTLMYVDEEGNPPTAEAYCYLKVNPEEMYRLTITVKEAIYDHDKLPLAFMRYVQLWIGSQPFEENFKAESRRIEEGEEGLDFVYKGLKTPTGFLYFRLLSLQDGITYTLRLEQETVNPNPQEAD